MIVELQKQKRLLASIVSVLLWILYPSVALTQQCELNRPVMFAGLDWDSSRVHTSVARYIMEKGYGCRTDSSPGSTIPLLTGLRRGDVDVMMEVWKRNIPKAWNQALAAGTVIELSVNYPDAVQGWYVPRYVIEGDANRNIEPTAPELKSVFDLPHYRALFRDPEEPNKGRFYNCILGWQCEIINTRKLKAYGLDDDYTNFRSGTAQALTAAIASAYKSGNPILAYYWGPTWVMGVYDMIKLEEPAYDREVWQKLQTQTHPDQACAYPQVAVVIGVNKRFHAQAPKLIAFLNRYETTSDMVNELLAFMRDNRADEHETAMHFLKTRPEIWTQWVPDDVADRVKGTLGLTSSSPSNAVSNGLSPNAETGMFPDFLTLPLSRWINNGIDWLTTNYGDFFDAISNRLLQVLVALEDVLRSLPWWSVVLVLSLVAWHARQPKGTMLTLLRLTWHGMRQPQTWRALGQTQSWRAGAHRLWQAMRHPGLGVGLAVIMILMGMLELWDKAMQTLALMLIATSISVVIGVPIGVVLSRSDRLRFFVRPVLDAMQTMPSFVYLIPALLLFGLGKVPALFATIIYAIVPLIRMTDLGIRMVDKTAVEAAEAFGATSRQQLFGIYLPLALPNIMAGINQTTMLALSMVVIASMIGARGLGEEVLLGIQRLDVGRGVEAGLAIVFLAIIMDRITQAYGQRSHTHWRKSE